MTWVCITDDDPEVCDILAEALGRAGLEVRAFTDASDAREAMAQASEAPGALVLDLVMPHLTGQELIAQLRADPKTAAVPVVVLTGLDLSIEERAALGVQAVLDKPARIDELLTALSRALGR